jgi:hypothetical protein
MIINGIQNIFFPTQTVDNLQTQLAQLQTELGTGLVSQDYAGIPNDRGLAISLQSQISLLANYDNVTSTVGTRLDAAQQALSSIGSSATDRPSSDSTEPELPAPISTAVAASTLCSTKWLF